MPLLMCPNDNSPMQTLERTGVQFDMCPTCRGVWLDRGELEKLMEASASESRAATPSPSAYAPPPPQPSPWGGGAAGGYREEPRRDDYRRDDRYDGDRYRKKKRDSIFDIFD